MESDNINPKKQKTGIKSGLTRKISEKEQFRIVLNKESNKNLEDYLAKANHDFKGGALTRTDIANYVFRNIHSFLSEADIKNLRAEAFDDKQALLKLGKSLDELPDNVKIAIREAYGLNLKEKKKPILKATNGILTEQTVDK